jgi:hypothetical protein
MLARRRRGVPVGAPSFAKRLSGGQGGGAVPGDALYVPRGGASAWRCAVCAKRLPGGHGGGSWGDVEELQLKLYARAFWGSTFRWVSRTRTNLNDGTEVHRGSPGLVRAALDTRWSGMWRLHRGWRCLAAVYAYG